MAGAAATVSHTQAGSQEAPPAPASPSQDGVGCFIFECVTARDKGTNSM